MANKKAVETTTPTPNAKTPWTEFEKIALAVAIVNSYKASISWAAVELPVGRTKTSCKQQYGNMVKSVADVAMVPADATPAQKRKAADDADGNEADNEATPTKPAKRGRKGKAATTDDADNNGVEEPKPKATRSRKAKLAAEVDANDEGEPATPKKRGRKAKAVDADATNTNVEAPTTPKKRGRKAKAPTTPITPTHASTSATKDESAHEADDSTNADAVETSSVVAEAGDAHEQEM